MSSTLRAFLNERRAAKGKPFNVTGMSDGDKGIYNIPDCDYAEFLRLHHDHVFVHSQPSSFLERHTQYSPILIDLDFRYDAAIDGREFGKPHIYQFVKAYAEAFHHFVDYNESIRFFVELKPAPTIEGGVKKDGIHIICPDISVDYDIPFVLRKYTLEQSIMVCFPSFTNTTDDCFDESVIKRNNWFLHGATKPGKDKYEVVYCFILDPDGTFEETVWDESNHDLTSLFSIKRVANSSYSIRDDVKEEWNTWKSLLDKKTTKKSSKTISNEIVIKSDDAISIVSNKSDSICRILRMNDCMWDVKEQDDGSYMLTHDNKTCLVDPLSIHTDLKHSCLFVKKSSATFSCFSHRTKRLPKTYGNKLWKLLSDEEDDVDVITKEYTTKKADFEKHAFRILDPPGYMVFVEDKWIHYTRQQIIDMNSGIFLDDDKRERFIDWWLRDQGILTYTRLGYFVDKSECSPTIFNTFCGFSASHIEPELANDADIQPILDHLMIVANHNDDVYEFLLDWMASCIQTPGKLNHICLVIIGDHGSGKDILFEWFGSSIIGLDAYYKTGRPHIDLFGSFNSSRENRVFYHIEEGNEAAITDSYVEQFKNYITDKYASIQHKGKDTTGLVKNYNHFMISSNNTVPFKIHLNERRFFAVRASREKVRNSDYFKHLATVVMELPGVKRAFYDFLMARDLSGRDWCNPPETDALREWKGACVSNCVLFLEDFKTGNATVTEMKSSDLYTNYKDWCKEYKITPLTLRMFGMEMKKILGEPQRKEIGSVYTLV